MRPPDGQAADDRHGGMCEVRCDRCAAVVRVAKFSPEHTSVQWTSDATAACAEFAGRRHALVRTCESLRESIDRAVREGRLEVSEP